MSFPALNPENQQLSMTSLEISELVDARHDKVKQSIERLVSRGVIVRPPMGVVSRPDEMGRPRETRFYVFQGEGGKRDSIVVIAQMSPEFTARIIDRWRELEAEIATPLHRVLAPYFKAAIAAYEELEENNIRPDLAAAISLRAAAAIAKDKLPLLPRAKLDAENPRVLPERIVTPLDECDLIGLIEGMREGETVFIHDPAELGFASLADMRRVLAAYHRRTKCKIGWITSGDGILIERNAFRGRPR